MSNPNTTTPKKRLLDASHSEQIFTGDQISAETSADSDEMIAIRQEDLNSTPSSRKRHSSTVADSSHYNPPVSGDLSSFGKPIDKGAPQSKRVGIDSEENETLTSRSLSNNIDDIFACFGLEYWEWKCDSFSTVLTEPPYPLKLVGNVERLVKPLIATLENLFLHRTDKPDSDLKLDTVNILQNSSSSNLKWEDKFHKHDLPSISLEKYILRICYYIPGLEPLVLFTILSYAFRLDPPATGIIYSLLESYHPHQPFEVTVLTGEKVDMIKNLPIEHGNQEYSESTRRWDSILSRTASNDLKILSIDRYSVHRFLIASICLASKAMDDCYYSNEYYAKVGGISVPELNALELDLASRLGWYMQCTDPQEMWLILKAHILE
jgi:hypothetical protein